MFIYIYSEISPRFKEKQSLLLLLNAACVAEEQQIPNIKVFGLTRSCIEPTIYRTRDKQAVVLA